MIRRVIFILEALNDSSDLGLENNRQRNNVRTKMDA